MSSRSYLCIDLKSYYASVECVDRGLNPLTTNLVVADEERTDGTICLAVSPSLKARGISGRARLFEVKQRVREIRALTGEEVRFITAIPRMQRYLDVSAEIYGIYLKYVSREDIHVYSIDEAFLDVTHYLKLYGMTARELAVTLVRDVLSSTGITATAGVGANLYLAKIAMDIVAKHVPADADGVRVAELDERSFREKLWAHEPLTDFWGIAGGTSRRLARIGVHTMGDLARMSLADQEHLYREFGVDAEILIDHAWGQESCGMEQIKKYRPATHSLSSGQVLKRGYPYEQARLVVREMTEEVICGMVDHGLVAEGLTLYLGYERLRDGADYRGPVKVDHYGRLVPASAHGTAKLGAPTVSPGKIMDAAMQLFGRIADPALQVRRLGVAVIRVCREEEIAPQLDLFSDHRADRREIDLVKAQRAVQRRFGSGALFKGCDLLEGATALERNQQIGGHRA